MLHVILFDGDERYLFEDTPMGRRAAAIKLADGFAEERKMRHDKNDFIEASVEKLWVDGTTNFQDKCHSAAYYYEDENHKVLIEDKGWPEMREELEKAWKGRGARTRKRKQNETDTLVLGC